MYFPTRTMILGGGDIDMTWLDGATGCKEECNLANNYVTFKDFLIKTSP